MNSKFTARATTTIHASVSKVWQALVNPEIIKQYLFNTDVISDWREGSPVLYRGEWQGKAFEDKGRILKIEPEKVLVSTIRRRTIIRWPTPWQTRVTARK
jgi:uncharacterized protein YndB with AHSA1/START domain